MNLERIPAPSPARELKRRDLMAQHKAVVEELEAAGLVVLPVDCLQWPQLKALREWYGLMAVLWTSEADMLQAQAATRFGPNALKP